MTPTWIFDGLPASRARKGGLANTQVFDPSLDSFVREVLQNSRDQRHDDQRVDVRLILKELTGPALRDFLDAIGWNRLEEHIEGSADPALVTIGPRLREGLEWIANGTFRVLLIEDSGTRGLVGDEDEESNFANLCKHELMTGADRRASGGSFGLGKSVLWRFSNLSTVLFYSITSDERRDRFIGRVVLPAHEAEEGRSWEGSGWFGAEEAGPRAVSLWDEAAQAFADQTGMERPDRATGTSILVLGFDEPALETERDVDIVCADIVESATRWFWPALLRDDISVLVEGWVDDERVFTRHAQPINAEVAPFVHALEGTAEVDDAVENPGDVAEFEIAVQIPRQKPERFDEPRDAIDAKATLRVRLAESGEDQHANTVALQRGAGMVVDYKPVKTRAGSEQRFHAVLQAGRARGAAEADQALEEFLRAAEPPAHSEWTHTTERIRAEYMQGFRATLTDLFGQIEAAVRELTREEIIDSDEGPDALKRLFPMPGVGAAVREESYRLADAEAELDDHHWTFSGRYVRKLVDDQDSPWRFRVALFLDQESAGGSARGDRVPLSHLHAAPPASVGAMNPDGSVDVSVPAGNLEVPFSGRSEAVEVPADGLRRVKLRLDLKSLRMEGAT